MSTRGKTANPFQVGNGNPLAGVLTPGASGNTGVAPPPRVPLAQGATETPVPTGIAPPQRILPPAVATPAPNFAPQVGPPNGPPKLMQTVPTSYSPEQQQGILNRLRGIQP